MLHPRPTSSGPSVAAKSALIALGAVLVAAGGGAIGYGVTRHATGGMTPAATRVMTTAIAQLDGDIKPAIQRLVDAKIAGRLELGGQTRAIGEPAVGATERVEMLPSEPGAQLVVAVPPMQSEMPLPLVAGGAAGALVGLLLLVTGMIKKPAAAPGLGSAVTQL